MKNSDFSPFTSESTEVALFTEAQIPWDDLAFLTVKTCLRQFFADRSAGKVLDNEALQTHLIDLRPATN
jgi:hypothetical protein